MNRSDISNAVVAIGNLKIKDRDSDDVIKVSEYNRLIEIICEQLNTLSGKVN